MGPARCSATWSLAVLAAVLVCGCSGLSVHEKILEGSPNPDPAGLRRVRRQADTPFIPLEYYGADNDPAQAGYPRSVDGDVNVKMKYINKGVPNSPQKARLRGDVDHMNPNEGRVEVEILGQWGLACDDFFGMEEANVYCKSLGYKKGANKQYGKSFFKTGSYKRWDIIIGHVKCSGFERQRNLFQCNHNTMPACGLESTAGVECTYNDGCEYGWSAFDGLCYRLETAPLNADEAVSVCAAKGAKLLSLNSEEENNFITNMFYTKFRNVSAAWTGGRYAKFKDSKSFEGWTFKDTIHMIKRDSKLWFPGFPGIPGSSRPTSNIKKRSCIAISKIFNKADTPQDVDVNYFWWDNVSCKTQLPYVCQKLGTVTRDCYSDKGENYTGEAARTNKGTPCQPWTGNKVVNPETNPGKGLADHNYCRNPDGDSKPWCWVDNERNVFGYCSLRKCDGTDGGASNVLPADLKPGFIHPRCQNTTQFFCPSMINYRPMCIDANKVCDTYVNCVGGEDENKDLCKARCTDKKLFYCSKSHRCIPMSRVCDKSFDCEQADDEEREMCKTHKAESDEDVLKDYNKTPMVDEASIPAGSQSQTVSYNVNSVSQCKARCDSPDGFVCKSFIVNQNGPYGGLHCTLLPFTLPGVKSNDSVQDSAYYEKKSTCDPATKHLCTNTHCVDKAAVCNGYDDCGDFSDEIGPAACPSLKSRFEVALGSGKGTYEGRVEVKLFNEWGLVCDDGLDDNMGKVVCNQLGFPMGVEKTRKNARKEYGRGSGKFLMGGVQCTGSETTLYDCKHSGWKNTSNCGINNVAGLICMRDRACTDKEFRCSGRCIPLAQVCDGIQQCEGGVDEEDCKKMTIQLVNGNDAKSGLLEVTRNGIVGAICDDNFGENEAKVACAQLKIPGRWRKEPAGTFKAPNGLVMWLQDIKCTGSEASLFDCNVRNWGKTFCEVKEAVNLRCGIQEPTTQRPTTTAAPTVKPDSKSTCGQRIGRFPAGRIINGYPAIKGQFPWQVGIRLRISDTETTQHCGGTVISDRWIVTAAHCFEYPKNYYALRIGDLDNEAPDQYEREFDIDLLIIHPQYAGAPTFDYDITLIRIAPDAKGYLQFNEAIQPACLPDKTLVTDKKTVCHISGWGSVGDMQLPRNLMAANVPLITNERCNALYPGRITDRMQCAGFEAGGIDSCQGDSGGPLVCPINGVYTILGATSWGEGCAMPGSPGVYANIRNLRGWIDEQMRNNP